MSPEVWEPWYSMLMGKRLPPYGQNTERAKAWGMACMRHSDRSLTHELAQERAEKLAEELAAAAAREDFPCARECRCSMRWPLGTRLVIKRVEKELRKDNYGAFGGPFIIISAKSVRVYDCVVVRVRGQDASCVRGRSIVRRDYETSLPTACSMHASSPPIDPPRRRRHNALLEGTKSHTLRPEPHRLRSCRRLAGLPRR